VSCFLLPVATYYLFISRLVVSPNFSSALILCPLYSPLSVFIRSRSSLRVLSFFSPLQPLDFFSLPFFFASPSSPPITPPPSLSFFYPVLSFPRLPKPFSYPRPYGRLDVVRPALSLTQILFRPFCCVFPVRDVLSPAFPRYTAARSFLVPCILTFSLGTISLPHPHLFCAAVLPCLVPHFSSRYSGALRSSIALLFS